MAKDSFEMDLGGTGADYQAQADNLVLNLADVDESKASFEALPAGVYNAVIENVEYGLSQNGGNPMLSWEFKITDAEYENRKMFYHTVLNKELGIASLKKLLIRVCPDVEMSAFNPQQFADNGVALGLPCQLKVKIRPYQGEKRNQVQDVLAPVGDAGSFLGQ